MNWLDRAERRFGHLGIPGLAKIIVGLNLLVFVLYLLDRNFLTWLELDRTLIMQGQVWRLVTFLFIPGFGGIFGEFFSLLLYLLFVYFIGNGLEQAMGTFRFTLYYVAGAISVAIAAFIAPGYFGNAMLNLSLLFAFARYYPDAVIYIFFILPAKVKWLAWITAALLLLGFVQKEWDYRVALIAAFLNFFLFFGADIVREARTRREVADRRGEFRREVEAGQQEFIHECVVCKRTDVTSPELDFRVARDGQEYCTEHLPKAPSAGASQA